VKEQSLFFTFGLFEIVNADLYPSHLLPLSFLLESGHFLFRGHSTLKGMGASEREMDEWITLGVEVKHTLKIVEK
jgi:hypothetical protein